MEDCLDTSGEEVAFLFCLCLTGTVYTSLCITVLIHGIFSWSSDFPSLVELILTFFWSVCQDLFFLDIYVQGGEVWRRRWVDTYYGIWISPGHVLASRVNPSTHNWCYNTDIN